MFSSAIFRHGLSDCLVRNTIYKWELKNISEILHTNSCRVVQNPLRIEESRLQCVEWLPLIIVCAAG